MKVQIMKVYGDSKLPQYATEGSAGFDLIADNFKKLYPFHIPGVKELDPDIESISLEVGSRILIGTGIAVKLPKGFEMQIRPRSGTALKNGITVLNAPGTIDSDYVIEIGVILINHGNSTFNIKLGDRIAQGVITAFAEVEWDEVSELEETTRKGGFGSTDIINEMKLWGKS